MIHSIECEERTKDWEEKYPNRCKSCNGSGGTYYPGTYEQPPDFSECDDCVGQGKCTLCGQEYPPEEWDVAFNTSKDTLPCGHRWWNSPPECDCGIDQVCPKCRHEMRWRSSHQKEEVVGDSLLSYEVNTYQCHFCGTVIDA